VSNPLDLGSNALALGRDVTESRHGIMFANPHFPWFGPMRFYAMQQTLRGDFDVLGAMPVTRIQIGLGTNRHVAWGATFAASRRHFFYRLELVPDRPTAYRFDGEEREMARETITVRVLGDDGVLEERSHTFYSTHFGFVVESPGHPWTTTHAYALRTAEPLTGNNAANGATLGMYRARSVAQMRETIDRSQSMTANLLAADGAGDVYFSEGGPVAHVTDEQLTLCADSRSILDGSREQCQWGSDPDAAAAGIFGPSHLPTLIRSDYVTQSNDSYWLVNEHEPITGIPSVVGTGGLPPGRGGESGERTLRTRSGFEIVARRLSGEDGLPGKRFTLATLQEVALANKVKAGELLRDDLVTICRANPQVTLPDDRQVDLGEACDVLAAWDLRANLDSRGAHLFREFMRHANENNSRNRWLPTKLRYAHPYDPANPLDGPRGLQTDGHPEAVEALAAAVASLRDAGIDLDARLGDIQHVTRNGQKIPLHGGPEMMGVYSKLSAPFEGAAGYPEVTGGSSWIQATELLPAGPRIRVMFTYSQSTNPASPHFADLTRKYSRKEWTEVPFEADAIRAGSIDRVELSE
jgi:acyl-homoserine-lactone acylase